MNLPSQKVIRGQIADASGHTDFAGDIDEAMDLIMDQVTKNAKWVYLNGTPYMFQNFDLTEQQEVRNQLITADEPNFTLTAKLQGGATKAKTPVAVVVRGEISKQPISRVLNDRRRAQLAVGVQTSGGKTTVDVVVSNYNGAKAKVSTHRTAILAALWNLLKDEPKKTSKKKKKASK